MLRAADTAAQAATVFRDKGRPERSLDAAVRAAELALRCDGARTPALVVDVSDLLAPSG
jgi:hypothetical protein